MHSLGGYSSIYGKYFKQEQFSIKKPRRCKSKPRHRENKSIGANSPVRV